MALFSALARFAPALNGFRHADLRPVVLALLPDDDYTTNQMTYDLRRLRLKGIIARLDGSHRYILTSYGRRVAMLITKMHNRIFNSVSHSLDIRPGLPSTLGQAFQHIEAEIDRIVSHAQLSPA
jgi:hypothetical protein